MCFSAEASFVGGVIIASIGVATIRKVHKPSQIVFASIPLFFGMQQVVEGFMWIILQNPEYIQYQRLATYGFLVMAQVFWPMMIPLAVLTMEADKKRRRILWGLLGMGIMLSLYYILCLLSFNVNPEIRGYHIEYVNDFPKSIELMAFAVYLIVSITPLFISTIKRVSILGLLMTLSCIVTMIFFTQYLTSVWCFFAALISVVIFWILRDAKRVHVLSK